MRKSWAFETIGSLAFSLATIHLLFLASPSPFFPTPILKAEKMRTH